MSGKEGKFAMESLIAAGASILVSAGAWLIADSKSKSRVIFLEEKLNAMKQTTDQAIAASQEKISSLEVRIARSEGDRQEIHRLIEKLDSSKASKEAVDSFRNEVGILRVDMDKRFDRLERLIEKSIVNHNS